MQNKKPFSKEDIENLNTIGEFKPTNYIISIKDVVSKTIFEFICIQKFYYDYVSEVKELDRSKLFNSLSTMSNSEYMKFLDNYLLRLSKNYILDKSNYQDREDTSLLIERLKNIIMNNTNYHIEYLLSTILIIEKIQESSIKSLALKYLNEDKDQVLSKMKEIAEIYKYDVSNIPTDKIEDEYILNDYQDYSRCFDGKFIRVKGIFKVGEIIEFDFYNKDFERGYKIIKDSIQTTNVK